MASAAADVAGAAAVAAADAKSTAEKASASTPKYTPSASYGGAGQSYTTASGHNPYGTPSFMSGAQPGYTTQYHSGAGYQQQTATCPFCFKSIAPGSAFCPNYGKELSKGYGNY